MESPTPLYSRCLARPPVDRHCQLCGTKTRYHEMLIDVYKITEVIPETERAPGPRQAERCTKLFRKALSLLPCHWGFVSLQLGSGV